MYEAIIFDCFGVLATDNWLAFKRQYFGDASERMGRVTELNHLLDGGLISEQAFLEEVAGLAGITPAELNRIMKGVSANGPLLDYITAELKPRYKIGLLSNVAADWLYSLFTPEQLKLFDAKALSHEIGVIKPDPRAYETIAERLEVAPKASIFIDDQEGNVSGAEAAGMRAIHYRDFNQVVRELAGLLAKE